MAIEVLKHDQKGDLLFEHARHMDTDSDFWFRMRGQSVNPMVDAVTPLLGMVARVRQLDQYADVPALYQKVVAEIQAIEQELHGHGYENGVILSFRYILCTFIDEAVMGKEWGSQSVWSENSLLARFHNETWGGEKVFALLDKLEEEPQRYRDILEFIWMCLVLGFQGRYRVIPQGQGEFLTVIRKLHRLLRPEAVNAPTVLHLEVRARKLWAGLAEKGDPQDRYAYAEMLRLGQGGKEEFAQAFKQYRLAAMQGNHQAQYRMGMMRQEGMGATRNRIHAYAWFSLATTKGMRDALAALNDLEATMEPEEIEAAQKLAMLWGKQIAKRSGSEAPV